MASLVRAVLIVALLAVPLVVVAETPRVLELIGSVPARAPVVTIATPSPALRLIEVTPSSRIAPLNDTTPPTLSPPVATATAAPSPRPTPTGERGVIGNTGGLGAVLRVDPVTGSPVAALHDDQVLEVLERRNVAGSGDWVRVRTADGKEGWVTGLVVLPTSAQSH